MYEGRPSFRPLVEQLQSSATQALAQPALALQQQAISLRLQAAQQDQQAPQPPTAAELM